MKLAPLLCLGACIGLSVVLLFSPQERMIGGYSTPLTGRMASQKHNAVTALEQIDGLMIPAGGVFSFNQHVQGWTKDMGYRKAPVSYNGQLVSSWGGGVCQTSTTLYNAALLAGMEIQERHAHHFAPTYVPPGRDAAVAYQNIDLKFKNPYAFPIRIRGRVQQDQLVIELVGNGSPVAPDAVYVEIHDKIPQQTYTMETGKSHRVRNSGKPGFEVTVWREWSDRRERISHNDYPAMHRIIEE
jgi:vancomycin resistance protein VanW